LNPSHLRATASTAMTGLAMSGRYRIQLDLAGQTVTVGVPVTPEVIPFWRNFLPPPVTRGRDTRKATIPQRPGRLG
jgi:hypothetical protein